MSKKAQQSNVFATGGGGNYFEVAVKSAYAITLTAGGTVPGLNGSKVTSIRQQARSEGYQVDDLLIRAKSPGGKNIRILFQIKQNLTISSNNEDFKKVLSECWQDYNNTKLFDSKSGDRIFIVKGGLNDKERNHLRTLLDWAKSKIDFKEFERELETSKEKQAYFAIFKETLTSFQSDGTTISDEEIWGFLKVVGLLSYDFVATESVNKQHIKNLITLSKNNTHKDEDDIWSLFFESISQDNFLGASQTITSIRKKFPFFLKSNNSDHEKSLKILEADSTLLFERITNKIGIIHFNRSEVVENFLPSIFENNIIILSGVAGVGKSAFAKEIFQNLKETCLIAFSADQLNRSRVSQTFSEMHVTESIDSIFSKLSLQEHKFIYIDSFEKLLEGEGEAFSELLILLRKYKDLKLVVSCRQYAVEPLKFKFFSPEDRIVDLPIPVLTENEIDFIKQNIPALKIILENSSLSELLKVPKYLDFANRLVSQSNKDESQLNRSSFKNELWEVIVKNHTNQKDQLHERRAVAFIDVAVTRAKKMTLYAEVNNPDHPALEGLFRDGIILKQDSRYSPAHDILEDWALIRYVRKQYEDDPNVLSDALGTQPAMRRGFRLWIENFIEESPVNAYAFIKTAFSVNKLGTHFHDEIVIAILRSELCSTFLDDNESELLVENAALLKKFIHLLRVACVDSSLTPVGPGWEAVITFLDKHLAGLDKSSYILIYRLLQQWNLKYYKSLVLPPESRQAGNILWKIVFDKRHLRLSDEDLNEAIETLFQLSGVMQVEVEQLLRDCKEIKTVSREKNWEKYDYASKILECALSTYHGGSVAKYFPDLLIEIAWQEWFLKAKPKEDAYFSYTDLDHYYGLKNRNISSVSASAYYTFIWKLFSNHSFKGLEFVVAFVNKATTHYLQSGYSDKTPLVEVELTVGEKRIKQHGSAELWSLYGGRLSGGPILLQSALMALERFLMMEGKRDNKIGDENIRFCFDYIYSNSTSVATTSVMASVAMAYPLKSGDKILPLLEKEFLKWDLERWIQSAPSFNFPSMSQEDRMMDREREDANSWEHKRKFQKGLLGFFIDHQFNIKTLNKEIFERLDGLHARQIEDINIKKILNEIDTRKWVVSHNEKQSRYEVQVNYEEPEIKEMVESVESFNQKTNESARYSNWIGNAYEGKNGFVATFEAWVACYKYYLREEKQGAVEPMFSKPGTLAVIGLKLFDGQLNASQRKWCVSKIMDLAKKLINKESRFDFSINVFDTEPIMSFLPLLLGNNSISPAKKKQIKFLIFTGLAGLENELSKKNLIGNVRAHLWDVDVLFAKNCFNGMLYYSKFRKENYKLFQVSESISKGEELKDKIIYNVVQLKYGQPPEEFSTLQYENYSAHHLILTLQLIPGYRYGDYSQLILNLLRQYIQQLRVGRSKQDYEYRYDFIVVLKTSIAECLLNYHINNSKPILIEITSYFKGSTEENFHWDANKVVREILEEVYLLLDRGLHLPGADLRIDNFWKLWEALFDICQLPGKQSLIQEFLLHTRWWNSKAQSWIPLKTGFPLLKKKIPTLGYCDVNALVRLVSGIGAGTLLPDGLIWVESFLKKNPFQLRDLDIASCEKLVEKIFRDKEFRIKENRELLNSLLSLLDTLIVLGSSKSYLIRENVLLYKSTVE